MEEISERDSKSDGLRMHESDCESDRHDVRVNERERRMSMALSVRVMMKEGVRRHQGVTGSMCM